MDITESALHSLGELAEAKGSRPLVLLLPSRTQFSPLNLGPPDAGDVGRYAFALNSARRYLNDPLSEEDRIVRAYAEMPAPVEDPYFSHLVEFGRGNGLPVMDLTKPLYGKLAEKSAERTPDADDFFVDVAHLNAAGNEALAEVIAEIIDQEEFLNFP